MTIVLLIALVAVNITWVWLVDRKDRRHDVQITRLLVHVQAPQEAVAHATSTVSGSVLYLAPEDDQAWNDQHKAAE